MHERTTFIGLATILLIQTILLSWSASRHGPGYDEPAHIASGLIHWRLGRYEPYRVNPHLVRMVATLPAAATGVRLDNEFYSTRPGARPEFTLGSQLIRQQGRDFLRLLRLCRWSCIPLAWVGTVACFLWARHLFGTTAGLAAATLWCFSPTVLGHAFMVMPDAPAASIGLAACYVFSRWLEEPSWHRSILSGLWFGLALLTKSTWIVLFGVWPALALLRLVMPRAGLAVSRTTFAAQTLVIFAVALLSLNTAYHFNGTFDRLGSHEFVSQTLSGIATGEQTRRALPLASDNRFRDSIWGSIPLPFPRDFVLGIDVQKFDFEVGRAAYIGGTVFQRGRWYYYLYAALVKLPVGTWSLLALAVVSCGGAWRGRWTTALPALLLPPSVVLILVSSQTGIHQHFRYALPALPFLLVAASSCFRSSRSMRRPVMATWRLRLAAVALASVLIESLAVYPHSLSFFNVASGGPAQGYRRLGILGGDSTLDWGLDVTYLVQWLDDHPHARPLYARLDSIMALSHFGFDHREVRTTRPLLPGWYAISVGALVREKDYEPFRQMIPHRRFGYSIYLYHVEADARTASRVEPRQVARKPAHPIGRQEDRVPHDHGQPEGDHAQVHGDAQMDQ